MTFESCIAEHKHFTQAHEGAKPRKISEHLTIFSAPSLKLHEDAHSTKVDSTLPKPKPNVALGDSQPIANARVKPVSGRPFSATEISHLGGLAIAQGSHGDCWFDSTLAGLAQTGKGQAAIASMITENPTGYTVTFPGDVNHPVHITEAEIQADHLFSIAKWAQVMEAALIKIEPEKSSNGAPAARAIKLLTGDRSDTYMNNHTATETLSERIDSALKNDELVEAATARVNTKPLGPTDFVTNHAYSVMSFDKKGPDGGTIVVRNPWGNNLKTRLAPVLTTIDGITNIGNGQLRMSLTTFQSHFQGIQVQHENSWVENMGNAFGSGLQVLLKFPYIPPIV